MKEKYFFGGDSYGEHCYTKHYWQHMANEGQRDVEVEGAKVMYNSECFFCDEHDSPGYSTENCGTFCKDYAPRNGVSGRCRHHKNTYEKSGNKYIIKYKRGIK